MSNFKAKPPIDRILKITKRFYALEKLSAHLLSEEYGVCTKTIHRDFQKISKVIPLKNHSALYSLDTHTLYANRDKNFDQELLLAFASNAKLVLDCYEKGELTQEKIAFSVEYNHLPTDLAKEISKSIDIDCKVKFLYQKKETSSRRLVSPIKLYSSAERWYLVAKDDKDGVVKNFYFGKIKGLKVKEELSRTLAQNDIDKANNKMSVWSDSSKEPFSVKLYVKSNIAEYLKDGRLHKSQKIYDIHYNGDLEIEYEITHKMELLPKIQSWLLYMFVIEPKWLQEELIESLSLYLHESKQFRDI